MDLTDITSSMCVFFLIVSTKVSWEDLAWVTELTFLARKKRFCDWSGIGHLLAHRAGGTV